MKKILFFLVILSSVALAYPDGCNSQEECKVFCEDLNNLEVCLDYAEEAQLMSSEELEQARLLGPLLRDGLTPGQCQSESECKEYCSNDENLEECVNFAVRIGEISQEEAEIVRKTGGHGPGNCRGKEECDGYCKDEAHLDECIDFAVQNGFMSAEEAEIVRKTGFTGPGGCDSKEECDEFCNKEENQATCFEFGMEHGLLDDMKEEDICMTQCVFEGGGNPKECEAGSSQNEVCNTCGKKCFNFDDGNDDGGEGQCFYQCMQNVGIDSKSCEGNSGPEECNICSEQCFSNVNELCLTEDKWNQLNQDCQAMGSGYHLEEVRGDDGFGGECVIDEICVYSDDVMWESQEEKDRKMAEMEEQWAREREAYEAANSGPGGSGNSGDTGGDSGSGDTGGDSGSGDTGGDSGSGDTGGDSGSGDTGGGEVATGMIIRDIDNSHKFRKFLIGI